TQVNIDPAKTMLFLCDLQEKFKPAIPGYDDVISTAKKMLRVAGILDMKVVATSQNAKALGPVDPSLDLDSIGELLFGPYDKTSFSMLIPDALRHLHDDLALPAMSAIIVGIEAHVSVLQTVFDLLDRGVRVFVLADGMASANQFEVSLARQQMERAGAEITTSESVSFRLIGDTAHPHFRQFAKLVKSTRESTRLVGEHLVEGK
ncbi:Isochorismatase hydrolase, partial [Fistulina hepatica ATCC 64428]